SFGELAPRVDVVVLGAGLAGASVALGLARAGQAPLLVDDEPPGAGTGTARSTGAAPIGPPDPLHVLVRALGRERAEDLYALSRESLDEAGRIARARGVPFERVGARIDERDGLEEEALALQRVGLPAVLVGGGLETDGAWCDPAALVAAVAAE